MHTYLNSHPEILSYGEILRRNLTDGTTTDINADVFKPHYPKIKAIGLKLFYEYREMPAYHENFRKIAQNKKVRVIHLTRDNLLDSFLSLRMALQTNQWSQTESNKKTELWESELSVTEFNNYLDESEKLRQNMDLLFTDHQVLHVTYESLTHKTAETLQNIQDFLNVKPRKLFSLLKKQGNADRSMIANYDDLEQAFEEFRQRRQS